jgi:hypothetical protein
MPCAYKESGAATMVATPKIGAFQGRGRAEESAM